ncbi:MAG: hypothetical protein O7D91_14540 [Planctomycetota bacterium]|nr:hypothetical protein [Planctomycetota bacterium]
MTWTRFKRVDAAVVLLAGLAFLCAPRSAQADKIHTTARVYPEASVRHFDGEFVIFSNAKGDPVARKLTDIEAIYIDSVDRFDEFNRAEQAFQQRRYDDAAQKYEKALGRARGFWKNLIRIRYVQACDAAGDFDLAVKMYITISQALPEKADLFMPSNFKGVTAKRFDEALRLLEETLPKIADQRAYWQLEALRLTILEQTESDQAERIAREVIARLRSHKGQDARYRLQIIAIRVEIKHGQHETALGHIDEALSDAGERFLPQLMFLKGRCLYGLAQSRDEYVRAGLAFMRVVIHFPKSTLCAQSMYMAGQVHEKISRISKAIELYEGCKELAGANDEVFRLADAALQSAEKLRSQSR